MNCTNRSHVNVILLACLRKGRERSVECAVTHCHARLLELPASHESNQTSFGKLILTVITAEWRLTFASLVTSVPKTKSELKIRKLDKRGSLTRQPAAA